MKDLNIERNVLLGFILGSICTTILACLMIVWDAKQVSFPQPVEKRGDCVENVTI